MQACNGKVRHKLKQASPRFTWAFLFYISTVQQYHRKHRDLLRALVLCRAGFRCYVCSFQSVSNHVHHFDSNKQNNEPDNLMCLCPRCHGLFEKGRFALKKPIPEVAYPMHEFFHTQILAVLSMSAAEVSNKKPA